jgi:protocatechuate 3,4-dioxygenase beta subunit
MNIKRSTAVLAVAIGTLLTPALFGQATASATIQGTVSDKTAAVIPGAEVKLTGKGTGFVRSASTNDIGFYRFDLVPPGNYEVRVTAKGFTHCRVRQCHRLGLADHHR